MSSRSVQDEPLKASVARTYQRPTLVRGPILTNVTAAAPVSGVVFCWIARAAFGENDIRWMIFREWLLVRSPRWFRQLYIRHGEAVGSWLEGKPGAQKIVRLMMMPAVNRVLVG